MILKVRHCCLLRLPRYCAKSLLTLKAFSLIAVIHSGASKNQCHQSSRLFSLCSDIKTRHTIAWQPPYHASMQNIPSGSLPHKAAVKGAFTFGKGDKGAFAKGASTFHDKAAAAMYDKTRN